MRLWPCPFLPAVLLLAGGSAHADERATCIAACEATAQSCLLGAHATYDACKPALRKTCAAKPMSELFECMKTGMKACAATHSTEVEPCRPAFDACYAACGQRPADLAEFWCDLDSDPPASDTKIRKEALCAGAPGAPPQVQWEACMARFKPTDPATSYSLACDQLP
ncbi:MAG: hypothetical protein AB7S70_04430 [Hyphomicrobium sp.]|uniref:hypothetical protein n=1 Tax=Hyphomicrobium sp. TaxID=82 RepID=UPI003D14DD1B